MKAPKHNCPRCNSLQSFRERMEAGEQDGTVAIFIQCTTCRWRRDLRISTRQLEVLKGVERKLLEEGRIQRELHGVVNGATRRMLVNVRAMKQREREAAGL